MKKNDTRIFSLTKLTTAIAVLVLTCLYNPIYGQATYQSAKATSLTTIDVVFDNPILIVDHTLFTSGDFSVTTASISVIDTKTVILTVAPLSSTGFMSSDLNIGAGAVNDGTADNSVQNGLSVFDGIVPTFVSANTISTTQVELEFSEAISFLTDDVTFIGTVDGNVGALNGNISGASVVSNIVTLTLTTPVSGDYSIVDLEIGAEVVDGGGNTFLPITGEMISDGVVPTFVSGTTVSTTEIELEFSEDISFLTDATAFISTVNGDGGALNGNISGAAIVSNVVTLILTTPVSLGYSITDLAIGAELIDGGGNTFVAVTGQTISDGTVPTFVSATTISTTEIELEFSEGISFLTDAAAFISTVVGDGGALNSNISGATIVSNIITLTLTTPVSGDYSITDLAIGAELIDGGGNTFVAITGQTISDGVAPGYSSTPSISNVTADGFDLNLTMDEVGDWYYVTVVDGFSVISSNIDIFNGVGDVGGTNSTGSFDQSTTSNTITGLASNSDYDIYFYAADDASNENAFQQLDISTLSVNSNSTITEASTSNEQTTKINYIPYNGSVGSLDNDPTIGNVVQVYSFTITDMGSGDGTGTIIDDVTLTVSSSESSLAGIRAIGLYDGTSLLVETGTISGTNTMAIATTVPDGLSTTVDVWVSFNTSVIDNNQFIFGVSGFNQSGTTSTVGSFTAFTSANTADENTIDVVATQLAFSANDPDGNEYERVTDELDFSVQAQDVNGNLDKDEASVLIVSGPTGLSTNSLTLISGEVTSYITISDEIENASLSIADNDMGNGNTGGNTLTSLSSDNIDIYDTTVPTSSTIVPANLAVGIDLLDDLTIQFSEEVAGVVGKSITIYSTPPTHVITIDADDTRFVNSDASGLVTIDLPEFLKSGTTYTVDIEDGAFTDIPNNTNAVDNAELSYVSLYASNTDWQFTTGADNVDPEVVITRQSTITGNADNGTNDTSVTFNIDWNEEINDATFIATDDISLVGSTNIDLTSGPTLTLTNLGDNMTYTLQVDGVSLTDTSLSGLLNITIGPDVSDVIGNDMDDNGGAGAVTSNDFVFDFSVPEIETLSVISDFTNNKYASTGDIVTINMVFSKELVGVPLVSVTSGGALVNSAIVVSDGADADETTWIATFPVNTLDTDGVLKYTLDFEDVTGNTNSITESLDYASGSTSIGSELTIDQTVPYVLSIERAGGAAELSNANGTNVLFTVTFSEDVAGVDITDFDLNGAASAAIASVSGADDIYTVTVTVDADQTGLLDLDFVSSPSILDLVNDLDETTIDSEETYTIDTTIPTLVDAVIDSDTQVTIELSEVVTTNGISASDFTVIDANSNSYIVSVLADAIGGDQYIVLTVADLSASLGDLTVTYGVTTSSVSDLSGNTLVSDASGLIIEREMVGVPGITEETTNTYVSTDNNELDIALYLSTSDISLEAPITITPNISGSTINIYDDDALTNLIVSIPSVAVSTSPNLATLTGFDFTDGTDDHGVYTYYITETAVSVGVTDAEGPVAVYSIGILGEINKFPNITVFASDNVSGTELSISDHPAIDQNVTFEGNGLTNPTNTGGTYSVGFVPISAPSGDNNISVTLENLTSNVSVTFEDVLTLSVTDVSNVFVVSQPTSFCADGEQVAIELNNPLDTDVGEEGDGPNLDFFGLEVYYVSDGASDLTIGDIASTMVEYDGASSFGGDNRFDPAAGMPTYITDEWFFDPSALSTIVTPDNDIDTLRFLYIVSEDVSNGVVGPTTTSAAEVDVYIYPTPTVTIENIDSFYCEDDDTSIEIEANIFSYTDSPVNGQSVIDNSFSIIQYESDFTTVHTSGWSRIFMAGITQFDPLTDLNGVGYYRLAYETLGLNPADCSAKDTVNFTVLEKPSIPELTAGSLESASGDPAGEGVLTGSTDAYLLEYVAGTDVIPTLEATGGDGGSYDWYGDLNLTTLLAGASTDIVGSGVSGIIQNTTAEQIEDVYLTSTTNINIGSSGFLGCISDPREIVINVYDIPNEPTLNVSGDQFTGSDTYVFEYCSIAGGSIELDDISLLDTYNTDEPLESYFTILGSDKTEITTLSDGDENDDPTDFTYDPGFLNEAVGSDTLYIVQTNYDNTYAGSGSTSPFSGVSSDTTIVIYEVIAFPDAPYISDFQDIGEDNTYKFCSGATLDAIETPNLAGYDYEWYTSISVLSGPTGLISTAVDDGGVATRTELGYNDSFMTIGSEEVTTYYVINYTNANDDTNFAGCPSSETAVEITVYPQPVAPSTINIGDEYDYCQDTDISSEILEITSFVTGVDGTTEFNWYSTDPDVDGTIVPFHSSDDNDINVEDIFDRTDLDISDPLSSMIVYLTQETDDLCESPSLPVTMTINEVPKVKIVDEGTSMLTTAFCYDETNDPVYEASIKPSPSGGVLQWSVGGTDVVGADTDNFTFDMSAYYDALNSSKEGNGEVNGGTEETFELTFLYTDANGCFNTAAEGDGTEFITVNPLPYFTFLSAEPNFSDADFAICESNDPILIDVESSSVISTGTFEVNGVSVDPFESNITRLLFDPEVWGEGLDDSAGGGADATGQGISSGISADYYISYELTDLEGCSNTIQNTITIYDRPEMTFIFEGACASSSIQYFGDISTTSMYDTADLSYSWSWVSTTTGSSEPLATGESNAIQNPSKSFDLGDKTFDTYNVTLEGTYVFDRASGVTESCISLPFEEESEVNIDPTVSFTWTPFVVGNTSLIYPYELLLENDNISSIKVDFGDGNITTYVVGTNDIIEAPSLGVDKPSPIGAIAYNYATPNKYDVQVTFITAGNCRDSLTREVNVLPIIEVSDTDQYIADFEGSFDADIEGWYAETLVDEAYLFTEVDIDDDPNDGVVELVDKGLRSHSWVLGDVNLDGLSVETESGISDVTISNDKPSDISGISMWSTLGTTGTNNYQQGEDSWVYSPVFDISELEKPMLSINMIHDFENSKDGAVVQYSTDSLGLEWNVLGFTDDVDSETLEILSEGLDWYDSDNVGADPGQQQVLDNTLATSLGWSGRSDDDQFTWKSARHGLDDIPEEDRDFVRFRIAMAGTDDGDNLKGHFGFAFDDFTIRSRNKNVLIEEFYVVSEDDGNSDFNNISGTVDVVIDDIVATDQIRLAYHISLDTDIINPFNVINTADPAARKSWYNLETITSVLDGEVSALDSKDDVLTWDARDLRLDALADPGFDIIIEADAGAADDEIAGTVVFEVNDVSGISQGTELVAYMAIIEKNVSVDFGTYSNVLRKLLPDASGQFIELDKDYEFEELIPIGSSTDNDGDETTLDIQWDIINIQDADELAAVAFIQNRQTKRVYQAIEIDVSSDGSIVSNKSDAFEDVLDIENVLTDNDFEMYPNPSDGIVTIKLSSDTVNPINWALYDNTGRVFDHRKVDSGIDHFEIETSKFPSGMYYIQLQGVKTNLNYKKLMILHE